MQAGSNASITSDDLSAFLEPLFKSLMVEHGVPGAVVAVVRPDRVLYVNGFGVADRATEAPVDPETSVFRVASVSKAVTATIIMLAVDDGLVELDADVNRYLKRFAIPNEFAQPVTLRHLMTHTGGFDDRGSGRRTLDASQMEPLADYLESYLPARILPPGEVLYYTNHQMTLASFVLQEAAGRLFEGYAKTRFFDKLGMIRTSYIRNAAPVELVRGYTARRDGAEMPLEYTRTVASTMLATTAVDMARFLRMHLDRGRYDGERILSESSINQMHTRQFTNHPAVQGAALGFYETDIGARRILTHGGGNDGAHGMIYLLPEDGLAMFMAFNTDRGAYQVRAAVRDAFFARYFPDWTNVELPTVTPSPLPPITEFSGRYIGLRAYYRSNFERISSIFDNVQFDVRSVDGDTLMWGQTAYRRQGPLLFRNTENGDLLGFRRDMNGEIRWASSSLTRTYERLHWYDTAELHLTCFIGCVSLFTITLLLWPAGFVVRRFSNGPAPVPKVWERRARPFVGTLCLACLGFLLLFLANIPDRYGISPFFVLATRLPIVIAVLSPMAGALTVVAWRQGYWSLTRRVYFTLVTLCLLLFSFQLYYLNLMGFHP